MNSDNVVSRLKRNVIASLTETLGIDQDNLSNYFINCEFSSTVNYKSFLEKLCDILNYLELYGFHSRESVLESLRKVRELARLAPRKLRDVVSLVAVYLCSSEALSETLEWAEDNEPFVRALAAKCLVKLFAEGVVSFEVLERISRDPSPLVREHLITSLGSTRGEGKREALTILKSMLARERRASLRTKIMESMARLLE